MEENLADSPEIRLLAVIAETRNELQKGRRATRLTLDSQFDRDLGFDSLGRVELIVRVERAFAVSLPQSTLETAATPRDLLIAVQQAPQRSTPVQRQMASVLPIYQADENEPEAATTLLDALDWHAGRHPERIQIVCLEEGGEIPISYGLLQRRAAVVAGALQAGGLLPGQTVAIMLPTSPDYFYAYFGILRAGGVPVPIYPPARLSQIEEHVRRHTGILANAETSVLVTVPEAMAVARLLEAHVPALRRVTTVTQLAAANDEPLPVPVHGSDTAFIQYTSGSTGNPKGVVLSHANLLANIRAMGAAVEVSPADVMVSWLPLYHDMGLIAAWLSSVYFGNPFVVMSPLVFLARPERWLWAIHNYRGTLTAAPNFAYELCCKRIDAAAIEGLDLSSLRLMANGAEPVSPETLERFCQRFAAYGFARGALAPVYGLAESTVGLAVPPLGRGPLVDRVEREAFVRRRQALPVSADNANALSFVACGRPLPGHEIRIVDETGQEVAERVEGDLQFRGPSATAGYYRRSDETQRLKRGDWLDSGDRAYLAAGEVYISGRVKDIIIRSGRNIYPHEVEAAVGALPGVRNGCVAAFGSRDGEHGTEKLIVLAETAQRGEGARKELIERINQVVVNTLGEAPDEVVLAPLHSVLKTSSGKLRRSACRELYENGAIGSGVRAPWAQVLRLAAGALWPQARRAWAVSGEWAYALRVWGCFALMAPLTWLAVVLAPNQRVAWALAGRAARLFFALAGIPLVVRQPENLPASGASVLVANHASYLDGLVLAAVLPRPYTFVAKQELRGHWLPRRFLDQLGVEYVERFVAQDSTADAERLIAQVAAGRSLAYFPEGTFKRMPGLLPFRLGAFAAAVRANAPLLPVALRGTRSILRGDSFFPRRGTVVVSIAESIRPAPGAEPFGEAIRLRDACRRVILMECGEPSTE